MRELKFRAWDEAEKDFDYSDALGLEEFFHYFPEGGDQYTGYKDKNSNEIYEGDILGKRPYGYFKSDGTKDGRYKGKEWECFAVAWGEYDACEAGLVSGYEFETDGRYAGWNLVIGGVDDDLKDNEVIGNIYQNPELLGEKNARS